ncbi:hypothetical protein DVH26_05030 [Paenibacillus sp. H1-7]|nr:hypothetical protein DVH26_05030 [Paenibacillus sp. H1-7]
MVKVLRLEIGTEKKGLLPVIGERPFEGKKGCADHVELGWITVLGWGEGGGFLVGGLAGLLLINSE